MPRVSVIIPAFNAEEHLEQALRSVQGQTYDDWEIVLCDDCSTDGTAERARAFGDRLTLVRTEGNSGPAAARNVAIRHSRGQLLALLDADDYWLPTYLARQVSLYDSGENVGIVACNAALLRAGHMLPETHGRRPLPAGGHAPSGSASEPVRQRPHLTTRRGRGRRLLSRAGPHPGLRPLDPDSRGRLPRRRNAPSPGCPPRPPGVVVQRHRSHGALQPTDVPPSAGARQPLSRRNASRAPSATPQTPRRAGRLRECPLLPPGDQGSTAPGRRTRRAPSPVAPLAEEARPRQAALVPE